MKKLISLIVIISIILTSIIGCNKNDDLVFLKQNTKKVNKNIRTFMDKCNEKNGIYLYVKSSNDAYLYLNEYNENNMDKSPYISNVKAEVKDNDLIINLTQENNDNTQNKEIDNRLLYKITKPKNVNTIIIYKNGQKVNFEQIEG